MTTSPRTSRRTVLGTLAAAAGSGALAGCLGGSDTQSGATPVESLPAPVQGDPDADVTVMAFEDYACPHCRSYTLEVLPKIEAEYVEPGAIRYEYHDFPIPVDDRWSWGAAGAARAVQDGVDDETFFEYSRLLYENQSSYSIDLLRRLAEQVGADPDRVERAAGQDVYRPVLQADREKGTNMGLDGTPEVFVNDEKTPDPSFDTVAAAIDAAMN